jgi:hypothetical protein
VLVERRTRADPASEEFIVPRCLLWTALAAVLAVIPAAAQQKPGKNRTSEDAAKWVESAGDQFFLTLMGAHRYVVVLTTDKDFDKGDRDLKVFRITKEDAAAVVRVLADSGLWGRNDTLAEIPDGRILTVWKGYAKEQRGVWRLGDAADDLSSLVIVQHLLRSTKGECQQALKDWLSGGPGKERK